MDFGSPKEHKLYATKINELLHDRFYNKHLWLPEKSIAKFSIDVVANKVYFIKL
jgi:hypothetical protein